MIKYFILLLTSLSCLPVLAQETNMNLPALSVTPAVVASPWYTYSKNSNSEKLVKFYTDGFRVSLGTVDSESGALMIKRELAIKIGIDLLYIYKEKDKYSLRLGDFIDNGSARQMMFQLIQLGYTKARVVEDKIYSF